LQAGLLQNRKDQTRTTKKRKKTNNDTNSVPGDQASTKRKTVEMRLPYVKPTERKRIKRAEQTDEPRSSLQRPFRLRHIRRAGAAAPSEPGTNSKHQGRRSGKKKD
jgi:hypothetical protein